MYWGNPHFKKGQSLIASDARNRSCHSSQHELLAFLACLEISLGSGEGSGIDNGSADVSVCAGSSEGEAVLALWEVPQTCTARLGKVLLWKSVSCCVYWELVTKVVDTEELWAKP